MRKRTIAALVVLPLTLVLGFGVAVAQDQTNGSGLTHEGASLGFNAKANLKGNITYTSHDGTMWQVQCRDGLTSLPEPRADPERRPADEGHRRLRGQGRRADLRRDLLHRQR